MDVQKWLGLKQYLDDHDIPYELDYVCICAGGVLDEIHLPLVFFESEPVDYEISPEAMKTLQEAVDEILKRKR